MTKLRSTLLASTCVLVAAVSAIGAAPASATFTLSTVKCTGGTNVDLCYENKSKEKLELTGTQPAWAVSEEGEPLFEINNGLVLELLSKKGEIESITLSQPSPLTGAGTMTSTGGDFTGNSLEGPTTIKEECKFTSAEEALILTNELKAEMTSETLLKVEPKTGTAFVELTLENVAGKECPALVLGKHAVTGFQNYTILEAGVPTAVKLAEPVELNTKFIGNAAGFEVTPELEIKFETKSGTEKLEDNVYLSKEA